MLPRCAPLGQASASTKASGLARALRLGVRGLALVVGRRALGGVCGLGCSMSFVWEVFCVSS